MKVTSSVGSQFIGGIIWPIQMFLHIVVPFRNERVLGLFVVGKLPFVIVGIQNLFEMFVVAVWLS